MHQKGKRVLVSIASAHPLLLARWSVRAVCVLVCWRPLPKVEPALSGGTAVETSVDFIFFFWLKARSVEMVIA